MAQSISNICFWHCKSFYIEENSQMIYFYSSAHNEVFSLDLNSGEYISYDNSGFWGYEPGIPRYYTDKEWLDDSGKSIMKTRLEYSVLEYKNIKFEEIKESENVLWTADYSLKKDNQTFSFEKYTPLTFLPGNYLELYDWHNTTEYAIDSNVK